MDATLPSHYAKQFAIILDSQETPYIIYNIEKFTGFRFIQCKNKRFNDSFSLKTTSFRVIDNLLKFSH